MRARFFGSPVFPAPNTYYDNRRHPATEGICFRNASVPHTEPLQRSRSAGATVGALVVPRPRKRDFPALRLGACLDASLREGSWPVHPRSVRWRRRSGDSPVGGVPAGVAVYWLFGIGL